MAVKKWNEEAVNAISEFKDALEGYEGDFVAENIKHLLAEKMEALGIKMGKIMQALTSGCYRCRCWTGFDGDHGDFGKSSR